MQERSDARTINDRRGLSSQRDETYQSTISKPFQPNLQSTLQASQLRLARQARAHQAAEVHAQIQARARNSHLRFVDPRCKRDKRRGLYDAGAEAAGENVQRLPERRVSAPSENQQQIADERRQGTGQGE